MKKIFIEAHKMTREMVQKYGVDYQLQFGLNLSYLLNKKEEEEMIKLYKVYNEIYKEDDFYFADLEGDKVYELDYNGELIEQTGVIVDDFFDVEDAEEVKIEDYYNVKYIVSEVNTYEIKEIIKAEGGKWNGSNWTVPAPSKNFETKAFYTAK